MITMILSRRATEEARSSPGAGGGGLPSLESLRAPQTAEDASRMVSLGERLLVLGLEGAGSRLSHVERGALAAVFGAVLAKMKVTTYRRTF